MVEALTPVEIFCSYAHEDETWLRKLETHLSLLQRQGLISLWHDRLIVPGTDWAKSIDTHLETASVILVLVSADFLASDYCYSVEMKRALERHAAGEARVVPILVRPVDWQDAPFAHLKALPTDAKPIASWRDKDTALADVAASIRQVIVEELPQFTASAPRAALPNIWNVPYPRNPFFLGRESELLRIRQYLQMGQATAILQPQTISGLGGIGKTQLAVEYAWRHRANYSVVLWVRADTRETLNVSYSEIATLLHLPERTEHSLERQIQAVQAWLRTHRDYLLILDNADDLSILPPFLPLDAAGHLLFTTRSTDLRPLRQYLSVSQPLRLSTFTPAEGAKLLLTCAGLADHATVDEEELAQQIAHELGGLALALDQAGTYLARTGISLSAYLRLFQSRRADLLKWADSGLYPLSVAATWEISFARLEKHHPDATELLNFCAFLAPDAIPEELLTHGAEKLHEPLAKIVSDPLWLNEAVATLRGASLIERDAQTGVLMVHRLVQAVVRDRMGEEEQQKWMQQVVDSVMDAFPDTTFANWPLCEALLPHGYQASEWFERAGIFNPVLDCVLNNMGCYLCERGRYAEAVPLMKRALAFCEQFLEGENYDTAMSLNQLAWVYVNQGSLDEAEPLMKRALTFCEQILDDDDEGAPSLLNGLAALYREQGRYGEAEPLCQRALAICEQHLGDWGFDIAMALNDLADLYYVQNLYEKAEPLYEQALAILEQELEHDFRGTDSLFRTVTILNDLTDLYLKQGRFSEAEPLCLRALAICEQEFGVGHPKMANSLQSLAAFYFAQGKYEEAELPLKRALAICEKELGANHPETQVVRDDYARLLSKLS